MSMSRKKPAPVAPSPDPVAEPVAPTWTPSQLLAVKHLGPAVIGAEMHAASQAYVRSTSDGIFGPALLG